MSPSLLPFSELHSIATRSLQANLVETERGVFLTGGKHQFCSLWTRDFCFASQGLLELDRSDVVRTQVNRLLEVKRSSDSLVPRLLDSVSSRRRVLTHTALRWIPRKLKSISFREPLRVEFLGEHGTLSFDSNLLVIVAALRLSRHDRKWFVQRKKQWQVLLKFYDRYFSPKDGLIRQNRFSDWQDSVTRYGKSFYLNLLYYYVMRELHREQIVDISVETLLRQKQILMDTFFDPKTQLFRGHKKLAHISLDGNLLALDWNFFEDASLSKKLYVNLKKHPLWQRWSTPGFSTYPDYPESWVSWTTRVVGLRHYHDRLLWSWLIALAAKVASQQDDRIEAERILRFLEDLTRRDQSVCEVYDPQNFYRPFESWMYRSEAPFSWGAGVALEAIRQYRDGAPRRSHLHGADNCFKNSQ